MRLAKLFGKRIGGRIAVIVGLAMAAGGAAGLFLVVDQTKRVQRATTVRSLHALGRGIAASYETFDPTRKQHPVEGVMAAIGQQDDGGSIDIFNHDGKIRWSTSPSRVGRDIEPEALDLLEASRSTELGQGLGGPPTAPSDGSQSGPDSSSPVEASAVTIVMPLRVTTECRSCHTGEPDPIGGLVLRAANLHDRAGVAALSRQAASVTFLCVLFLSGLLLYLIHRLVVARLEQLVQVMSQAEEGDFLVRAKIDAEDEIGALSSAFNKMLAKITDLRVERIDAEREMTEVKDELDLKRQIAEKNELLQAVNDRLSARVRQLSFLNQLSHDLASRLDLEYLLDLFSERVKESLQVPQFAVLLVDQEKDELRVVKARGFGEEDDTVVTPFPIAEGVSSEAVRSRKPVYVPNVKADGRKVAYRTGRAVGGTVLAVPIVYHDRVLGLLNFSSSVVDAFREEEREFFVTIAHQAALALGNARLFEETLELTLSDGLTGLLNRRAMEGRLDLEWSRSEREGTPLSLIMIDIDHFKVFNDQNGHLLGDETLRRVARILESSTRRTDACARYGGEEFLVILPNTANPEALDVAKKLRRSVEQADFVQGYRQPLGRVTVSCGVATAPRDATSIPSLVHAADQAMLLAKRQGRNRVEAAAPSG